MGWDVVQIGLKHDLPVDDPIATAELVAKRMNCNIKLVYWKKYEYDRINNIVSDGEGYELIQLAEFAVNSSKEYLPMIISNYQAQQILKEAEISTSPKAKCTSPWAKKLLSDIQNQFELYEIETEELYIRIFRENIDLDVNEIGRWYKFNTAFYPQSPDREWLLNYRMKIFERARIFGCKEVVICSDQGPTMGIFDHIDYSAERLKQYVLSNQYYEESNWFDTEDDEEFWKKHGKKVTFSSVFQDDFKLEGDDFVEVVYDDFKDLI
jgi:hypothetical protein